MFNRDYIKKTLLFSSIALCLMVVILSVNGAAVNVDHSIPRGLYWKDNNIPKKWDYVLCDMKDVSQVGTQRNYANGLGIIGKRIVGTPGDTVQVLSGGIAINGLVINNSKPSSHDSQGRRMPIIDSTFVLRSKHFFLLGSDISSFDSRYFGPVSSASIKTIINPIFTF